MERFFKYGIVNLKRKNLDWHRNQYIRWLQERSSRRMPTPLEVLNIMKYELYRKTDYIEAALNTKSSLPIEKNIEPFIDAYLDKGKKDKPKRRSHSYYAPEEHQELRAKLGIPDPANDNPWDFGRSDS
jgi:hypothetical protein